MQTDVVIIGAGPAGCAAAWRLADQGVGVVLLDRCDFPRTKTCGDGLSPPALELLDEMGVGGLREVGRPVYRTRVHSPDGNALESFSSKPGLVLARNELDHLLVRHAVAAGARFFPQCDFAGRRMEGDRVEIETRSGARFSARWLLLAGGSHAAPLRKAGLPALPPRGWIGGLRAYYENVDCPEDTIILSYEKYLLPGYGWIFPTGGGRANVGIGTWCGGGRGTLRERFNRFVESSPVARPLLRNARLASPVQAAPMRAGFRDALCAQPRTLAIGEALCGVNPLSGEGIYAALLSGKLAAGVIADALRNGDSPLRVQQAYRAAAWEAIGRRFRRAEWVSRCFHFPFFLNRLIARARNDPRLADIASYASIGDANPLTRVSLLRLLRFMLSSPQFSPGLPAKARKTGGFR